MITRRVMRMEISQSDVNEKRKAWRFYREVNGMLDHKDAEVKVRRDREGKLRIVQLHCDNTVTIE